MNPPSRKKKKLKKTIHQQDECEGEDKISTLPDDFIDYAVSRHVEDFTVHFRREQKGIKFCRFSSNSITKLDVRMKVGGVEESDCWDLPALTELFLWLLPTDDDKLPVRCLTCLPALRTLSLMVWDLWEQDVNLCLPELTTLTLIMCKMPKNIWNFPCLKSLKLQNVEFPGNMNDMFAALVTLESLALHGMSLQDCYIRCPRLLNLEIESRYFDSFEDNIVVLAPKLTNFTALGIFQITFEDSKLENVYLKVRGWINRTNIPRKQIKEYYQQYIFMLPGLGRAEILNLQLETIEALSSLSDSLVGIASPFHNLKYVKLPPRFEEASLSNTLRCYLLDGSPTATIVATLPQNIVSHTVADSVTAQNVVIEETLAARTLVNSEDIQKDVCFEAVDVGVQEELVVHNSKDHAVGVIHGAAVEGICNDHVSSSRGNTYGLWQCNEVKSEFVCLLDQIMKKYPETFEHLTTKNKKFCTMKLNMLCTAVSDFIKTPMAEVDAEMIVEYMEVFTDLKKLGLNVSWLVNRLNYIEQNQFSQPLPPKLHATDCHNDDAKSNLQDLQIRIDDAKTKLQNLQTLRSEKMQEIQEAFGTIDTNLAVGCVGDGLLAGP
ncbi:hypothetical protein POM88_028845 [Heracleum sosnowskyi]|uniref:Uncharacterized protein n=1 Tax=Heracleum sosnowskyi TaxID=360622 RepID=A0AAD8HSM4_9APIA|nr:hypothetical protein POM88_028845 [Heracleum sosnowskyi]